MALKSRASKPEPRGFQYQQRSKDDLKERANMKGGNFDTYIKPKFKQWKPKEGKNLIRILPPTWEDARHYGLDIFVNFNIGADNQSYLSLGKHGKGADPLAEARREAQNEGDKKLAKALNPSQRILYWIIDRTDEDEGPLLWAAPFTFDKSLSNLCIDEDTKEVIFIDDPATGADVRFYREGTGLKTTYDPSKMKVLKESPIHDDEGLEGEWLDFIEANPLPDVLNFYDYEHIQATFNGQAGREEDDDEDKPVRGRKRAEPEDEPPARSRRSAPPEETEDPPARRGRGPRRDQEEEYAQEELPLRRGRRAEPEPESEDNEPEPEPAPRGRRRSEPEPEPEDEPVARRSRTRVSNPDAEDEPAPRNKRKAEPEEVGSLRDRIARRRRPDQDDDIPF